uniref:Mediator of RNA polymerase II transcription subunit 21 n=1 Tax=Meloidogyne floridensis TaxID=298350 RepID=A0A915NWH5_9BILA
MASTSALPETAPPVEQMMEEISADTETIQLEQRLECLKDVDWKVAELMAIVAEVLNSLEKDKPVKK